MNGLLRLGELAEEPMESFSSEYSFALLSLANDAEYSYFSDIDANSVCLTCF